MNFFEQELRKLFAEQFPNATYVGRNCYIPLDNQIRACISFKTNGYADHYDTIHIIQKGASEGVKELWDKLKG